MIYFRETSNGVNQILWHTGHAGILEQENYVPFLSTVPQNGSRLCQIKPNLPTKIYQTTIRKYEGQSSVLRKVIQCYV